MAYMPAMAPVAVVTAVPALVQQADDETSYIASDYGTFGASGYFHV
jgi:hypothetical protein